jgi:phage portal protein BeeE
MRTDTKTKAEYFSKAIFGGWMSRNEVRKEEDLNPVEGLDDPLTPVNTQTLEQLKNGKENE